MHTSLHDRALVLHGGGAAGNAWEIGVIAGLLDGGLDVTDTDLVVGTSAGATAAAQITSEAAPRLLAAILDGSPTQRMAPRGSVVDHLARTDRIITAATDAPDMRRRMGAGALELDAEDDGSWSTRWRETVAARLPGVRWPEQRVLITAVDARTGARIAFDRESGVDVIDAVAASTSSGLPYRIGDERYIDGGYGRNENADLAAGFARVLVLSPFSGRTRHPLQWGMQLAAQVEELEAAGSRVETVFPNEASLTAFGGSMTNPATREPAARAGFEQGRARADRLAAFWR